MPAPPSHHFDPGKPFYPLVINYVCQLVGVTELAVRGIAGPRHLDEMVASVNTREHAAGIPLSEPTVVRENFQKITGSLQLRSEILDKDIGVPFDVIAEDIAVNFSYVLPYFVNAAGIVLVMAHEISKCKPWYNHDPIWEFLRHCRNAVAHGGRFHFLHNEPRRPAHWGPFVLASALEATPLFKKDGDILSPGDPIRLLWDIEQAYPAMIA